MKILSFLFISIFLSFINITNAKDYEIKIFLSTGECASCLSGRLVSAINSAMDNSTAVNKVTIILETEVKGDSRQYRKLFKQLKNLTVSEDIGGETTDSYNFKFTPHIGLFSEDIEILELNLLHPNNNIKVLSEHIIFLGQLEEGNIFTNSINSPVEYENNKIAFIENDIVKVINLNKFRIDYLFEPDEDTLYFPELDFFYIDSLPRVFIWKDGHMQESIWYTMNTNYFTGVIDQYQSNNGGVELLCKLATRIERTINYKKDSLEIGRRSTSFKNIRGIYKYADEELSLVDTVQGIVHDSLFWTTMKKINDNFYLTQDKHSKKYTRHYVMKVADGSYRRILGLDKFGDTESLISNDSIIYLKNPANQLIAFDMYKNKVYNIQTNDLDSALEYTSWSTYAGKDNFYYLRMGYDEKNKTNHLIVDKYSTDLSKVETKEILIPVDEKVVDVVVLRSSKKDIFTIALKQSLTRWNIYEIILNN